MSLQDVVRWFEDLKAKGVTKDEILDVLEFDSDQYPDPKLLEQAKLMVYG